jgi:uncharacterized lipoprotein
MRVTHGLILLTLVVLGVAGCKVDTPSSRQAAGGEADGEAGVKANLAQLPPEDRKLAEDQKYCAVEDENRLGSMGKPYKVMVNEQPVFLCCKGCRKKALADPDRTLARVQELKARAADEKGTER